jgi:hypothetical protein
MFILSFVYSGDPLSNTNVEFKSPEDAMDFCEKNGIIHF